MWTQFFVFHISNRINCSRTVAGSCPDEVDFLNWPNLSGRTGPGVDSASNRNEYQESLKIKKPGGKVRPARRAYNLLAVYLSNVGVLTSRNPMGLHGL
jgi:hypothetical protein